MSSDEINQDELAQDAQNKEMLLEIFYKTKGNIDDINAAIDKKLFGTQKRSITIFEKYIKARLTLNPKVLNLANQEITPIEAAYLSQYPGLEKVEKLDLRKNRLGDEGLEVLLNSEKIRNVQELDLRNNQITREGMIIISKTENLLNLQRLDLRVNKLGKRWEVKLKEQSKLPKLSQLRIA
ncbi:hypothetical protein OAT06_05540 [Nitrospinaceae bacterium]|nr:hypothetical protein [Nitrospinaceae bacterium]